MPDRIGPELGGASGSETTTDRGGSEGECFASLVAAALQHALGLLPETAKGALIPDLATKHRAPVSSGR